MGRAFLTLLTNFLLRGALYRCGDELQVDADSYSPILKLTCSGFDLDFELSDKLALATRRMGEVPIGFNPRTYQQGKKIRLWDGLHAVLIVLRDRFVPSHLTED